MSVIKRFISLPARDIALIIALTIIRDHAAYVRSFPRASGRIVARDRRAVGPPLVEHDVAIRSSCRRRATPVHAAIEQKLSGGTSVHDGVT